jgi:16S rRNA processing protein RimM
LLVEVGRLVKAHGIKGDLLVASFTDVPEIRFGIGAKLYLADGTELTVTKSANHSGNLILHFAQIDDRTKAELVSRNMVFADIDENELPPEPGRYFDRQLIGLSVVTVEQQVVGKITEMLHLPAQDMFVVVDESNHEYLIPFVDPIVIEVDLAAGTVLIDPPPGLLNLAEAEDAN